MGSIPLLLFLLALCALLIDLSGTVSGHHVAGAAHGVLHTCICVRLSFFLSIFSLFLFEPLFPGRLQADFSNYDPWNSSPYTMYRTFHGFYHAFATRLFTFLRCLRLERRSRKTIVKEAACSLAILRPGRRKTRAISAAAATFHPFVFRQLLERQVKQNKRNDKRDRRVQAAVLFFFDASFLYLRRIGIASRLWTGHATGGASASVAASCHLAREC